MSETDASDDISNLSAHIYAQYLDSILSYPTLSLSVCLTVCRPVCLSVPGIEASRITHLSLSLSLCPCPAIQNQNQNLANSGELHADSAQLVCQPAKLANSQASKPPFPRCPVAALPLPCLLPSLP